ncbi:MAG: DUF1343 domain-containing protein [Armatimonadota bacterium]|nr:DUF1343 domain-containing protein [Armatimonadota bacterium]
MQHARITFGILSTLGATLCCSGGIASYHISSAAEADSFTGRTLPGIDVLAQQGFAPLRGKRIGLVTNQTGIARDGRATIDVLAHAPGVKLVALFAPEHGVRGNVAAGQRVASGRDKRTGLPVYSLYGGTRRPSSRMLRGVQALVFDLQDIGSRSYTYIATMGQCMEACAAQRIPFVVLDRPNPLGGDRVEGNILETRFRSFVGPYPIAYCHGMTVGEIARMANGRGWLAGRARCSLTVVPMQHYRRSMLWGETGLPWRQTSPNIPYAHSPFFYAMTGIVGELSALSIGVGTAVPFEVAGAPGLDAWALEKELARRRLDGLAFSAVQWKPAHGRYRGQTCTGVQIHITDYRRAALTRLNWELMDAVRKIAPAQRFFGVSSSKDRMFDLVCGTNRVRRMFAAGQSSAQIWAVWNAGSAAFRQQRQPYLLYP